MGGLYRVLVVDDEMLIRQGVINYIDWEQEGFQIVGEASNGNEALNLIERLQPHLVITDVVMPGMDGIELVRTVKEQDPKIEIIVLSSFENFDYVRSTFQYGVADYILKPKLNGKELTKTLREIVPDAQKAVETSQSSISMEKLLQKSLAGYSLSSSESSSIDGFPYNYYSLIAACGLKKSDHNRTFEELSERMLDPGDSIEAIFIPSNESDIMLLLLNFDSERLPFIRQSLKDMAVPDSDLSTSWLMSDPFTSIHEMKKVYENHLLKMKDYLFYLNDEPLLLYDSLPALEKNEKSFDLSRFLDLFKQKKFDVALSSLQEHVSGLTGNYTKDIFEFKSWLQNIMFNIIVLLGDLKYDVDKLEDDKYEYFAAINEAGKANEAIESFQDFLSNVKRIVLAEKKQNCPPDLKRLMQYIEEHYAEPITLTTLADYFHFNPSYLSSYFSTHLNVGFSDYLNQVRIVKAKHLLESSSASVSMVSEMVGYSDPSYFCKVFKRMEGASPGIYRKKAPAMN
ncbi:response regulator transcription factor [Halobacillus campisalis]|uniref:Response regulator n=1 Tax=Halobacillus campisalis TaxID=435909 RepID=A0ABW2K8T3_9BACI|nr:response regulator transcription factor [Halobacillus campisalis]